MSTKPPAARRPGRPPRLSREAVLEAAQTIIEGEGIEALSMRRVADALGCSPMALYRHVSDKDALLAGVMDRVLATRPRPALPEEPRERLIALVRWQHDGLADAPWVLGALSAGLVAPSALWLMEEIYAAFAACGLGLSEAATSNRIVWQFMIGELHGRVGRSQRERSSQGDVLLTSVDADAFPHVAALASYWATRRGKGGATSFEADLAVLLDGLLGVLRAP